jgi:RNA polymerase sigma factor (sigma-70 family)
MAASANSALSTSLLHRLRIDPTDQEAWRLFVDLHGREIFRWCRRWGLQSADAEDVTQEVLLAMARQLPRFDHDPTRCFTAFLRLVTYRSWCRSLSRRERDRAIKDLSIGAPDPTGEEFLATLARDGERELLAKAMELVRARVSLRTWEAFTQTAIEERTGWEVAERLQINVATVFVARNRVQRMLIEELHRLDR